MEMSEMNRTGDIRRSNNNNNNDDIDNSDNDNHNGNHHHDDDDGERNGDRRRRKIHRQEVGDVDVDDRQRENDNNNNNNNNNVDRQREKRRKDRPPPPQEERASREKQRSSKPRVTPRLPPPQPPSTASDDDDDNGNNNNNDDDDDSMEEGPPAQTTPSRTAWLTPPHSTDSIGGASSLETLCVPGEEEEEEEEEEGEEEEERRRRRRRRRVPSASPRFSRDSSRMSRRSRRLRRVVGQMADNNNDDDNGNNNNNNNNSRLRRRIASGNDCSVPEGKVFSKQLFKMHNDNDNNDDDDNNNNLPLAKESLRSWKKNTSEFVRDHRLWNASLNSIEGQHGSGIMAYFSLLRWLLDLNIFITVVIIGMVFVPVILISAKGGTNPFVESIFTRANLDLASAKDFFNVSSIIEMSRGSYFTRTSTYIVTSQSEEIRYYMTENVTVGDSIFCDWRNDSLNCTKTLAKTPETSSYSSIQAAECSTLYIERTENAQGGANEKLATRILDGILDLADGTGWISTTPMFLSSYHNLSFESFSDSSTSNPFIWDYGLFLIATTMGIFLISLIAIVLNSASKLHQSKTTKVNYKKYFVLTLCGWDHCIKDKETSDLKRAEIRRHLLMELRFDEEKRNRSSRTLLTSIRIWGLRVIINAASVAAVVGCFYLIDAVIMFSAEQSEKIKGSKNETSSKAASSDPAQRVKEMAVEFLPAFVITLINVLFPFIFDFLVRLEVYRLEREVQITLYRRVSLRIISLLFLMFSYYQNLSKPSCRDWCKDVKANAGKEKCVAMSCWEQIIGSQVYKLALFDFFASIIGAIIQILKYYLAKLGKYTRILAPVFDIPNNVLDLVYSQILCWLGVLFCPLIPLITCVKLVITFYIKRALVLKRIFEPTQKLYQAERMAAFFQDLLLFSFFVSAVPVLFSIFKIEPSKSCGPFRVYSSEKYYMSDTILNFVYSLGELPTRIFTITFGSLSGVILFILLSLVWYYYKTMNNAYEAAEEMLQEMSKREEDKCNVLLRRAKQL